MCDTASFCGFSRVRSRPVVATQRSTVRTFSFGLARRAAARKRASNGCDNPLRDTLSTCRCVLWGSAASSGSKSIHKRAARQFQLAQCRRVRAYQTGKRGRCISVHPAGQAAKKSWSPRTTAHLQLGESRVRDEHVQESNARCISEQAAVDNLQPFQRRSANSLAECSSVRPGHEQLVRASQHKLAHNASTQNCGQPGKAGRRNRACDIHTNGEACQAIRKRMARQERQEFRMAIHADIVEPKSRERSVLHHRIKAFLIVLIRCWKKTMTNLKGIEIHDAKRAKRRFIVHHLLLRMQPRVVNPNRLVIFVVFRLVPFASACVSIQALEPRRSFNQLCKLP